MKDQFVTYEIARRLSELGYNEETFTYYFQNQVTGEWELHSIDSDSIWSNDLQKPFIYAKIAAPLYQQAIDWLRMRRIHCLPYPLWFNSGAELNYSYEIVHEGEQLFKGTGFKTPEEAREAAVTKALELIK